MALYLKQLPLGPMENFIYLLGAEGATEVAVVDPAWDAEAIERAAEGDGKLITAAFATHSHPDHTNALPELLRRHRIPVYAQKAEVAFAPNLQELGGAVVGVDPGQEVSIGALKIRCLHTPGHTPGAHCLLAEDAVLTGDTVFVNAWGRSDLRGGDPEAMYRSITEVLMKLPDETRLFPGHDYGDVPVSSIRREKEHNPYFRCPTLDAFLAYRMG